MKLALGTVQFGLSYGVSNTQGIPSDNQLAEIFSMAKAYQLNTFDTAIAYGNAEQRIAPFLNQDSKVISKFPKPSSKEELEKAIVQSLQTLHLESLYGFMSHNGDFLIESPKLWDVLLKFQSDGKINKIGYSLYNPEQLEKLLKLGLQPDIIQVPFSLLDRKFEPYFKELKSNNVEIHCRSVFLQGLYFLSLNKIPTKLEVLKPSLLTLHQVAKNAKIEMVDLALNYVLENKFVDKVVIGVENAKQLEQSISSSLHWKEDKEIFEAINNIKVVNKELLNPANW